MNIIGKHISLIGILLLTVFVGAAAGLYFDLPARLEKTRPASSVRQTYTCPMHADVIQDHPGNCPKCGMALVLAGEATSGHEQCGNNGQSHPRCCADKSASQPPTPLRLPPGHPPVPGWTTDAPPENKPASTNTPIHSSR